MKVAAAQINPLVGDLEGNTVKIKETIERGRKAGADLVVFPELSIIGYPPKDFLLSPRLVEDNIAALQGIAESCKDIAALVGFARRNKQPRGRALRNSAALCQHGCVLSVHHKSLLPTYDVFDEHRYFEPGPEMSLATVVRNGRPTTLGVSICEDIWNVEEVIGRSLYHADPITQLTEAGAHVVVNISASPFTMDKHETRRRLLSAHARKTGCPVVFVNQVGGNDELVFDGASMVVDGRGEVIAQAKAFEEDLLVVDLDSPGESRREPYPARVASAHRALVLGTRDYVRKCGFREVLVGLSGGIDSAVTACIAAAALGREAVHGVAMPSRYSSEGSIRDARELAENLGIDFRIIRIDEIHATFERELTGHFAGREPDVTEENVQARIRGNVLMALSNKFGWLLLATGNKTELSVGYCTLYGDMCGGLAVIGDAPKMLVYELARHVNEQAGREIVPRETIAKPPSAELRPDQTDQDSLPPYDVLDQILLRYVEQEQSLEDIVSEGFDPRMTAEVLRMVDRNEYKRKQAAPALKITGRAFGTGRRMPIAARHR
ncbi:MAG: NAD+ synthase [Phycisphaerae bacterium]|nr:NAD+ synthase [Phycisphaerae bacterium]